MEVNIFELADLSIYEKWKLSNRPHFDNQATEYLGAKTTFREEDALMNAYARAYMQFNNVNKDSAMTFCTLSTPRVIDMVYGQNKIGVRNNFISDGILAEDPKTFLDDADSETLLLLDMFVPDVIEAIANSKIKNLIIMSLADGAPEQVASMLTAKMGVSHEQLVEMAKQGLKDKKIEIIDSKDYLEAGYKNKIEVPSLYTPDATSAVLYTSGSTNLPKGLETTDFAVNTNANKYIPMGMDVRVGDRNGVFIPINHPTSYAQCIAVPWNYGTIQVYQPFYNRFTFIPDLINLKLQMAMVAPSHWATIQTADFKDGELSHVRRAFSGGEPMPRGLAEAINKELVRGGVENPYIALGYGLGETLAMTIFSPDARHLINKVGKPVPGVDVRLRDRFTGELIPDDEPGKGLVEIKSDQVMKGYWRQPELTKKAFTKDGYLITGDIAIRDKNLDYDTRGRADDSYVDDDGKLVELFEMENLLYDIGAGMILEAEVQALKKEGQESKVPIANIVLHPNWIGREAEVITILQERNRQYIETAKDTETLREEEGWKPRDKFGTNKASTKRNYKELREEYDGYYISGPSGQMYEIAFNKLGEATKAPVEPSEVKVHIQAPVPKVKAKTA